MVERASPLVFWSIGVGLARWKELVPWFSRSRLALLKSFYKNTIRKEVDDQKYLTPRPPSRHGKGELAW